MVFQQLVILCLLASVHSYGIDFSASIRWGSVRDNMLCFVRLAERDIGGVTVAQRGVGQDVCRIFCSSNTTNNRNYSFNAPDFSDCGFFQVCLSGECVSLANRTWNGRATSNMTAGLSALRSMYLSALLPGGGSARATEGNAAIRSLGQATGMVLPILLPGTLGGAGTMASGMAPYVAAGIGSGISSGLGLAAASLPVLTGALGSISSVQGSSSSSGVAAGGLNPSSVIGGGGASPPIRPNQMAQDIGTAISGLGTMATGGAQLATGGARLATASASIANAFANQANSLSSLGR